MTGRRARRRRPGTNSRSTIHRHRGRRPDPSPRRSAGPPRAGSAAGSPAKASSARVADRRRGTTSGGDRHADLTRGGRSRTQDLDQRRAGGDAQDQAHRQEDELAGGHAVRISLRSRSSPSVRGTSARQRSCERGQRQPRRARDVGSGAGRAAASALCSASRARMVDSHGRRTADPPLAPEPDDPTERHVPAWPSTPPRNSSSSLSTPPGCSATSSARKRARWGRTAAAT